MNAEPARTRTTIPCYEPATRAPLGDIQVDDAAAVRAAIQAARVAQVEFGAAPVAKRLKVLRRMMDHLLEHADALCEVIARDAGKTLEHAMMGEIWPVCEKIRWTLNNAEKALAPESVSSGLMMQKRARIEYAPRGVIGIICAWNYPLQHPLGSVVSALAAGNGAVIKVSEWVAWSAARVEQVIHEALRLEGFSTDLVRLVNGYGETGAALVRGGVDQVVFIGSVPNGQKVAAGCAEALIPSILELGGKDPYIVCDDANLDRALHSLMIGVFVNAGQNCLAAERILVHDSVFDVFEQRVVDLVKQLRCGPPLAGDRPDVGGIISPLQLDLIEELVDDAVANGAVAAVGGKRLHPETGQFFAPTVLTNVDRSMRIMNEEVFGPVILLVRVQSDDEAIEIANSTEFGLGSTIFSNNADRARAIGKRIQAGSVMINDFGMNYMVQDLPFGGVKHSGYGRLNGRDGLRGMCTPKSIVEDRLPVQAATKAFPAGKNDYATYRGLIQTVYTQGIGGKVLAIGKLLGAAVGREPHGE